MVMNPNRQEAIYDFSLDNIGTYQSLRNMIYHSGMTKEEYKAISLKDDRDKYGTLIGKTKQEKINEIIDKQTKQ